MKFIYVDPVKASGNKTRAKEDWDPVFRIKVNHGTEEAEVLTAHDIEIPGPCALRYSPSPHRQTGVIAHLEVEGSIIIDGKEIP